MQSQGRYTILGEIAAGGTATVFLAEDRVLRRKVALKKLHPHLLNHPEMVRRFQKEAVAVASLSHENVIKIFDYGQEDKGAFLAMEYVDGDSLDAVLKGAKGIIPNLAALTLFHQLLEGLAAAHACGIFHRDIKPSNVLIDRKGTVRLADFGIAFLSEDTSFTRTGAYLGTPGYSSPEQAEGKAVTKKTDIFATGTLFYRCLTGRMPFAAESPHAILKAIVEKAPPKACFVNPRILPGLADLAQDMLAKDPEMRPAAEDCLLRLERIAAETGFPLETERICRLLADPVATAEAESGELSDRFLQQGRAAAKRRKRRDALKAFSLAQIFSEPGSPADLEARRYLTAARGRARLAAGAGAMACVALLSGLAMHALTAVPARPAAGKAPPAQAAPAPAVLALPAEVPPWPQSAGNVPVTHPHPRPRAEAPAAPRPEPVPLPVPPPAPPSEAAATPPAEPEGYAWIKTAPPFARLSVDGKEMGQTPLPAPLALAEGVHRLVVRHEGCEPLERELKIVRGDTATLRIALPRSGEAP